MSSDVEVLILRRQVQELKAENMLLRDKGGIAFARELRVSCITDLEPVPLGMFTDSITLPLQASWTMTRNQFGGLQALGMAKDGERKLVLSYHSDAFSWHPNAKLELLSDLHKRVVQQLAKEWTL